ncbi:hypothetical protein Rsub_09399 [Raphidocelis subcapitata]|uniref:MOSC domain-containing protein n=1 Tax=Raphidocelis subcapitata TaxID=307507 RepID=A0A2V0P9T5_9CHLO|nr:hypothetical protein Rsub_09399 [Raphidocelis subcapitata]|eukprot:GBF96329.1 hypothetical protein Rsub_09399 [Raphidocelis subcapitata]
MSIASLHVYPVKSCAGISVERALLTPMGLPYDRKWMIVDDSTGRAVTQRTHPKMALIRASLPPEAFTADGAPPAGAALTLSAPGAPGEVRVPLAIEGRPQLRPAKVWEWAGYAADEGDAAADFLSAFLGKSVRLVRYLGSGADAADAAAALAAEAIVAGGGVAGAEGAKASLSRAVDPEFVADGEVAFADGFPVLVACEESLADLNTRLQQPIPMDRFRPNIVLRGAGPAWSDDAWGGVRLGGAGVEVSLVKPCSRCTVPSVEQSTGVVTGKEPGATMMKFRSSSALGWAPRFPRNAHFFGNNGQPLGSGMLAVGEPAAVAGQVNWAAAA